jgi:hypothetical protein
VTGRGLRHDDIARPAENSPSAALPFEAHDGAAPVSLSPAFDAPNVLNDPLTDVMPLAPTTGVSKSPLVTRLVSAETGTAVARPIAPTTANMPTK